MILGFGCGISFIEEEKGMYQIKRESYPFRPIALKKDLTKLVKKIVLKNAGNNVWTLPQKWIYMNTHLILR